jgi:hypothetical protein
MLNAIGRENWKHYMDAFRCRGGDLMAMYLVLNFGYSITELKFHTLHHVRDPVAMTVSAYKMLDAKWIALMCQFYFDNERDIVLHKSSRRMLSHFFHICNITLATAVHNVQNKRAE